MKFFCEYCGCRIDAEKDTKCPNCGASYKKNDTFIRLEKERQDNINDINRISQKIGQEIVETQKTAKTFGKVIFVVALSIIIIIIITMISGIIGFGKFGKHIATEISSQVENNKEEKVTVGINEYGKTSKYQAKVTGYEPVSFWYKEPKDGYEFVKFDIMVENLTDHQLASENVNCIVDGVAQNNSVSSGYSTLPFHIESNLTVTGEATFEVPVNASSYDIRYGDYITIHIEK